MTKFALIFPGQGAQYVGMGKEFFDSSLEAKEIFEKADKIIPGIIDVIFNGPNEKLTLTKYSQPGIFIFSFAALQAVKKSQKINQNNFVFSCGLSLGEYAALAACGAVSFEDALRLIERRAAFMDEACKLNKGTMAAIIGFDKEKLIQICKESGAEVANFNSSEQIVITGLAGKVEAAIKKLNEAGAKKIVPLQVSGGFHSSLMQTAADKFKEEVNKTKFDTPKFPIISNVDAKPTTDIEVIKSNLPKQITSSVLWVDSINYIASEGVTNFLEIGPGTVLKGLMRKINKDLKVHNIQRPEDVASLVL